jgi:hypothetical protein
MVPLIIALSSAALFLGLSILTYGVGVLAESAWVALVFWGLIGAGLVVYLLGRPTPDWISRLRTWMGLTTGQQHPPCSC